MMLLLMVIGLASQVAGGPAQGLGVPRLRARPVAQGILLLGSRGERVRLAPRLLVDHRRGWGARGAPRTRTFRLGAWRRVASATDHWRYEARTRGPRFACRLTLSLPRGELRARLGVRVTYTKEAYPRLEALELSWKATGGQMVQRDLAVHPLPSKGLVHVGPWTPLWVALSLAPRRRGGGGERVVLSGAQGLDGLRVVRRPGGQTTLRLELDDARNHPWLTQRSCLSRYRNRAPTFARQERRRRRGEVARYAVRLSLGRQVPLWKHRWPQGRRAALTFTGHADQTRLEAWRAVLQGAGRRTHSGYGKSGFLKHGLVYTKSFFWRRARFLQPGESQPFLRLLRAMARKGFEIIPHSVTTFRDSRARTRRGLKFFAQFKARTWIDHRPETNCEAFSNRGWRQGSPWYTADLLHGAGYRYIWAGRDMGHLPWPGLNLLAPKPTWRRRPFLFQTGFHPRDSPRGFWIWYSQWMYYKRKTALRFWSAKYLDRLERDRGVHVAHVYLDALHPAGHRLHAYNMLQRGAGGVPVLRPGFARVLRELGRRRRAGTLWTTTFAAIADRLIDLKEVVITYSGGGRVRVHNRGKQAIRGLTLTVGRAGVSPRINGKKPQGLRRGRHRTDFWFDLPARSAVVVRLQSSKNTLLIFRK